MNTPHTVTDEEISTILLIIIAIVAAAVLLLLFIVFLRHMLMRNARLKLEKMNSQKDIVQDAVQDVVQDEVQTNTPTQALTTEKVVTILPTIVEESPAAAFDDTTPIRKVVYVHEGVTILPTLVEEPSVISNQFTESPDNVVPLTMVQTRNHFTPKPLTTEELQVVYTNLQKIHQEGQRLAAENKLLNVEYKFFIRNAILTLEVISAYNNQLVLRMKQIEQVKAKQMEGVELKAIEFTPTIETPTIETIIETPTVEFTPIIDLDNLKLDDSKEEVVKEPISASNSHKEDCSSGLDNLNVSEKSETPDLSLTKESEVSDLSNSEEREQEFSFSKENLQTNLDSDKQDTDKQEFPLSKSTFKTSLVSLDLVSLGSNHSNMTTANPVGIHDSKYHTLPKDRLLAGSTQALNPELKIGTASDGYGSTLTLNSVTGVCKSTNPNHVHGRWCNFKHATQKRWQNVKDGDIRKAANDTVGAVGRKIGNNKKDENVGSTFSLNSTKSYRETQKETQKST